MELNDLVLETFPPVAPPTFLFCRFVLKSSFCLRTSGSILGEVKVGAFSSFVRTRTFGPTGNGACCPMFGPFEWKMIGLHFLSSHIKLEFWKWEIKLSFPWILAYAILHTFSLLNLSHFVLCNFSWKEIIDWGSMKLINA